MQKLGPRYLEQECCPAARFHESSNKPTNSFEILAVLLIRLLCSCAGIRTVCHGISVELGLRAFVHKSGQASTDTDSQGASFLVPALVNGKHVDFHMFHMWRQARVSRSVKR